MKTILTVSLTTLILVLTGCRFDPFVKDVTSNPDGLTDFMVGKTYCLKLPAYLFTSDKNDTEAMRYLMPLGVGPAPDNLEEFRQVAPSKVNVAGLLLPGEKIRVNGYKKRHILDYETVFEVHAVIVSGDLVGNEVLVNDITKERRLTGHAFVDPQYLMIEPDAPQ
jgi:hypothetical protein